MADTTFRHIGSSSTTRTCKRDQQHGGALDEKRPSRPGTLRGWAAPQTTVNHLQGQHTAAGVQCASVQREQRATQPLTLRPLGEKGQESPPPPAELLAAALVCCPSSVEPSPSMLGL
jgi:hypothetical protein